MLGQVLPGKYRVSRLLDQGGMCKNWLAQQTDNQREVVVMLDRGERKSGVVQRATGRDLELRMERRDPSQPGLLTVTLIMRPACGMPTLEWRSRCQQIGLDLKAYLMGR